MSSSPQQPFSLNRWIGRPPAARWDSGYAVFWPERAYSIRDFIPLGENVREVRQGIFFSSFDADGVPVRVIRGADIRSMRLDSGEAGLLSGRLTARQAVSVGDVLLNRIGRQKAACSVTASSGTIVCRDSVLIVKPVAPEAGAVIAAALNSSSVQRWLAGLSVGFGTSSLSVEELCDVPMPKLNAAQTAQVHHAVQDAAELAERAMQRIELVRGEVGVVLERAPVDAVHDHAMYVSDIERLRGWSWQDAQRAIALEKGQKFIKSLRPFGELVNLKSQRGNGLDGGASEGFLVNASAMQRDAYLALPDRVSAEVITTLALALSVVDSEALLVPAAGNILASPAVIPQAWFDEHGSKVSVSGAWVAVAGARYPRALAVILDHPFLVLQRQLSSSHSTVPHITREDIAELLVPDVPEESMARWEELIVRAHAELMESKQQINQVLASAEEWYK